MASVARRGLGEALLAGHQLRTIVERRLQVPAAVLSRAELASMNEELRDPQHRIVQAMTRLLALVPTDFGDELRLGDARAIRDLALRLGSDDLAVGGAVGEATPVELSLGVASEGRAAAVAGEGRAGLLLVVDDMEAPRRILVLLLERLWV